MPARSNELISYIPLDKSWLIRMGFLDLLHGRSDCDEILQKAAANGSDLQALLHAKKQWNQGDTVDVGESGTLYRFLQFAAWKLGRDITFIKHGTLVHRDIQNNPDIVDWPLTKLLTLDNGTSQWASAAVLMGSEEPQPSSTPYKLQVTYDALEHWQTQRAKNEPWQPRLDETILKQVVAYCTWKKTGTMTFTPEQAEDYCFARAFGLITPAEGEARWPALRQHESDRIVAMEEALSQAVVTSRDHRVIQAVAMRKGTDVSFEFPEAVGKSWSQFWDFLAATNN